MNKSGMVSSVEFGRSWSNDFGEFDQYDIEFEDGTQAENSVKKGGTPKFVVGQMAEYEVAGKTPKGVLKIKPVKPDGGGYAGKGGGGGATKSGWRPTSYAEQIEIERAKYPSFAVSYWKDILVTMIATGTAPDDAIRLTAKYPDAFLHKMKALGSVGQAATE